jgi:hypothetical protein
MRASTVTKMEVEPLLLSIPQTGQVIGRSVATVYVLLGDGRLKGVKSDNRTLITMESVKEYVATLIRDHPAQIAPQERRKPQRLREVEGGANIMR